MNTIKAKKWKDIPNNFTGIVEWKNGNKIWLKDDKYHREDGPAIVWNNGTIQWWLNNKIVWSSENDSLDLTICIILSKDPHHEYPTIQIWKYLNKYGIQEQIVIPGMEEQITY